MVKPKVGKFKSRRKRHTKILKRTEMLKTTIEMLKTTENIEDKSFGAMLQKLS